MNTRPWSMSKTNYHQRDRGRTHGLRATYVHARCRCEPCREAERLYRRTYRSRAA